MNRRHARLVFADVSSVTFQYGAQLNRYGTAMRAASGPGHDVNNMSAPAAAHSNRAILAVARAPNAVAIEWMLASRSGLISWIAPNACAAMPHKKKATRVSTIVVLKCAPARIRPTTAGLTKWVLEVNESRTGRSLNRSLAAE